MPRPKPACARRRPSAPSPSSLVEERLKVHALHNLREAQAILRLAERYEPARLERACQRAREAGDGRYRTVRGILDRGYDLMEAEEDKATAVTSAVAFLRGPAAFAGAS